MNKTAKKCCGMVRQGYYLEKCRVSATVEYGGCWYCRHHNPLRDAEKLAAFEAKSAAEKAARDRAKRVTAAQQAVVDAACSWRFNANEETLASLGAAVDALCLVISGT